MTTRQNNDITDPIGAIYVEKKLSYHDRLNWVWSITKTRQDNDMINSTSATYIGNEAKLSWSIRLSVVYD